MGGVNDHTHQSFLSSTYFKIKGNCSLKALKFKHLKYMYVCILGSTDSETGLCNGHPYEPKISDYNSNNREVAALNKYIKLMSQWSFATCSLRLCDYTSFTWSVL